MSIAMKKQTTSGSVKRGKSGGLAEIKFSVLVPTAKINNVAKALEGVAALMPPLDNSQLKGRGKKFPAAWVSKFKDKGHEITIVTTEGEEVLNVEPNVFDANGSSLPDVAAKKETATKSKQKRFNKFGEEVVSLEDIFPNKHPGMVLKGFRQRDDMTQQQLADQLGIRQSRLCDLENGARAISKSMAEKLGKVFRISYKAFL